MAFADVWPDGGSNTSDLLFDDVFNTSDFTTIMPSTTTTTAAATTTAARRCLRLGVGILMPYVRFYPPSTFKGITVTLMQLLARHLNFCYRIYIVPRNDFGLKLPNGSWTGLTRHIMDKKSDFSLGAIATTYDRYKVIDFTEFISIDEHIVSYIFPSVGPDVLGFIKPYNYPVWGFIFATTIVMILAIVSVNVGHENLQRPKEVTSSPQSVLKRALLSIQDVTFTTLQILLGQGINDQAQTSLLLIGSWILTAFVIGTVYKSNLMSMLISPKVDIPFRNFDELVEYKDMPYMMPGGSYFYKMASKAAPGTTLRKVFDNAAGLQTNQTFIINAIIKGHFSFITYKNSALNGLHNSFTRNGNCSTSMFFDGILQIPQALGFPKKSPWYGKINHIIKRLNRFGIIQKMAHDHTFNARQCLNPVRFARSNLKLRPLSMNDFYGVFAVYAGGTFLGLIAFCTEFIWANCNRKRSKQDPDDIPINNRKELEEHLGCSDA